MRRFEIYPGSIVPRSEPSNAAAIPRITVRVGLSPQVGIRRHVAAGIRYHSRFGGKPSLTHAKNSASAST